MPKKSDHYGWSCSECYPDSSDSNPESHSNLYDQDLEGGSDAATQKRNRKRRLAASKGILNVVYRSRKDGAKSPKRAK